MGKYASLEDRIIANSVVSEERFWTNPETGEMTPCWEWTGSFFVNRSGNKYGRMSVRIPGKKNPVSFKVHRLVLMVFKGLHLTPDDVSAHNCNNTLCCNPAHLRKATQSENIHQ
jgi:hypothetical protein